MEALVLEQSNIKIIKTRAKIEPTLEIIGGVAISLVLVLAFRVRLAFPQAMTGHGC